MKKLMMALCAATLAVSVAHADCTWSWWTGDDKASKDVNGCALGLATERAAVKGAQVSICYNDAKEVKSGAQVALGCNFADKFHRGAQWSIGFNHADKLSNGCQLAFVNQAESASLQLGLLCFNKTGFLPFFVFFNFDKAQFGKGK